MALDSGSLKAREDRSRDLLLRGESNREIGIITGAEFGIPIAAARLAAMRKELNIEAKRGRRPINASAPVAVVAEPVPEAKQKKRGRPAKAAVVAAPVVVSPVAEAPVQKKAKAKTKARAVKAPKSAVVAAPVANDDGDVKALVGKLVAAMGREKVISLTVDRSGKCVLEQRIS